MRTNKQKAMLILNHLKPKNGLTNLMGPLSLRLDSQAITLASSEVAR